MGDIAEMMLDGTLCEWCGERVGEAVGYPRKCLACREEAKKEKKKQETGRKGKHHGHR
jgi:hypothetical protein